MKGKIMKYYKNQTTWMIRIWDIGKNGFSDYWPVSNWSKSRRSGLAKARESLRFNRGYDKVPRFTIVHLKDENIYGLLIPKIELC